MAAYTRSQWQNAINNNESQHIDFENDDLNCGSNLPIRYAAKKGNTRIFKLLLNNSLVDPSDNGDSAIIDASDNGHTEIVELLLKDPRVDPTSMGNASIIMAANNGHTDVFKLLLNDPRVDPSAQENAAILKASRGGCFDIVKLLCEDKRVDPSDNWNDSIIEAYFRKPEKHTNPHSAQLYVNIVDILFLDQRVKKMLMKNEKKLYEIINKKHIRNKIFKF
jgi:ankyrin repeat protein